MSETRYTGFAELKEFIQATARSQAGNFVGGGSSADPAMDLHCRQTRRLREMNGQRKGTEPYDQAVLLVYEGILAARRSCPDVFSPDYTDADVRSDAAALVARRCR